MNLMPGVQRVTADLAVGTSGRRIRVFCVTLISGATASTLKLHNGTSTSGTEWEQIDGVISQAVTKNYAGGLSFPAGCFANVDANIGYATIVFSEEA